jgi:hypothetical protein
VRSRSSSRTQGIRCTTCDTSSFVSPATKEAENLLKKSHREKQKEMVCLRGKEKKTRFAWGLPRFYGRQRNNAITRCKRAILIINLLKAEREVSDPEE